VPEVSGNGNNGEILDKTVKFFDHTDSKAVVHGYMLHGAK